MHLDVVRQRAQLLFSDLPAHLEHLTITRKTVTGLADRLPAVAPDLPEHPDYPRVLAAFHHATGPLRAKHVGEALGHELLPKNVEGTRAKRTPEALNESPSATCHSSGGACSS
nr:hypothetical protein [Streptomyces endocoffeicus]